MADIFLSHSSADNDAADQIKSWLERDRKSWSVFLDKDPRDGIVAGQGWQDRLRSELQSCRLVLAIITPDWLASRWCFTEAVTATFRGKDFVGVVPGQLADGALELAPPIVHDRQRQPLDLATGAGWDELLHALDRSGLDPSQWFPIREGVGPYPGFVAFEEKDAGVFFGRDQEITHYLDELNLLKAPDRAQALVISGGSGSGKSSLLKAGLIPRLRQQSDWLVISPFDLSREPIHALFAVLRGAAQATGADIDLPQKPPQTVEDLTELLQDTLRAIEEKANAWLLLPLDQAEVLLAGSQDGSDTDAARLLASVGRLLAGRTRKLVAVLTIRTEFMPALERALPSAVRLHDRSLRSITALSEIIEKPAARFGIELEEGLTGRMVEDTRGADALPLLAYTLRELNETYGDDNLLTVAEYERLGGVEGAIEKKLHEALSDPKPTGEELAALRRCFVRQLVRIDESAVEGERYLRTAVARDALPDAGGRLVERLLQARLLIGGDDGTIGIAHERLIRNWPDVPLQTWLAEDRDDRKLIDNLKSFLAAHRDGGPLLSEKPLLDAKDLLERDRALKEDEPELAKFIEESDTAEQTRQRRRKWLLGGAVAASLVFLVVAIGAVSFFLEAQEQTRTALSRQLAAQALNHRDDQLDLALLLSLEAIRINDAVEVRGNLLEVLESSPRLLTYLRGHSKPVRSVAFSPDGRTLASGSLDGEITLWDVATRQRRGPPLLGHTAGVYSVALSPDGHTLASGSDDSSVVLWDVTDVTRPKQHGAPLLGHTGRVHSVAFSPDGRLLASGGMDRTIVLWDVASGRQHGKRLTGHTALVKSVVFSPDGRTLASGDDDSNIILWDVDKEEQRGSTLTDHTSWIMSLAFSPDSRTLASGSGDQTIILWDVNAPKRLDQLRAHSSWVRSVAFSPDGRMLASGGQEGSIILWDVATRQPLGEPLTGHSSSVLSVAFSPDGDTLASGGDDNTVVLWDVLRRQRLGEPLGSLNGIVMSVDFSPDGNTLASGGGGNTIILWNLETRERTALPLPPRKQLVRSVAFSPDGAKLASGSEDNTILLWDVASGRQLKLLTGHTDKVMSVTFSPDGHTLASGSKDSTIVLWDVATGRPQRPVRRHKSFVMSVAFSPDAKWLATGSWDRTARLWELADAGNVVDIDPGLDLVNAVAFSPDGQTLALGSFPRTLTLWDVAARKPLGDPLTGHTSSVLSVAFSPDGKTLASSGREGSVILWDVATRQPLGEPLTGHTKRIHALAFSPDGNTLASGSHDKTIILWDVGFESWTARACRIAGRNLTQAEWRRFIGPETPYEHTCPVPPHT